MGGAGLVMYREGVVGEDPLHVSLRDEELIEEIQLLAELILAVGEATEGMRAVEIDQVLGVE